MLEEMQMVTMYSKKQRMLIPSSNDRFMSGWGIARRRINTCVVPCLTLEEAEKVLDYVEDRKEQKYVSIVTTPPRTNDKRLVSLVLGWRGMANLSPIKKEEV